MELSPLLQLLIAQKGTCWRKSAVLPLMAFVGLLKPHLKHFSALCVTKESSCVLRILGLCHFFPNIHFLQHKILPLFYSFCCQLKSDKALKVEAVKQLIGEEGSSASRIQGDGGLRELLEVIVSKEAMLDPAPLDPLFGDQEIGFKIHKDSSTFYNQFATHSMFVFSEWLVEGEAPSE